MLQLLRGRLGAWFLGVLFAVLVIEMVLLSPKALDPVFKEDNRALENVSQNETSAAQVMVGINVVETNKDQKEWELWADRAVSQDGKGDLDMEKVRIRFFGPEGIEFLVTGDRGQVDSETKNMKVLGSVVMESSNGYTFQTENMMYSSSEKLLFTSAIIHVKGPLEPSGARLTLTGQGMESSLAGEVMRILADVRASKKVPQRGGALMQIKSGLAELSSRDKSIFFKDSVTISLEEVRVSGPSARFVYDEQGRQLRALEMDGGIRVSDMDKWATSESVRIDLDKNQYVFKGRPRVVQDADELFGDEIVFLDGGRKVKVKNARVRVSKDKLEELN